MMSLKGDVGTDDETEMEMARHMVQQGLHKAEEGWSHTE